MAELRTPQGHTLLLPEGCVSIGADPTNEVPVAAHLGLAPVHFRLQPWEGGHFLEDAGSGLGTLVNGHSVNWKPLNPGDVIVAGELEVVYSQQSQSATSPVPAIIAPAPPAGLMGAFPLPPAPALPAVGQVLPEVGPALAGLHSPSLDHATPRPSLAPLALANLAPGPSGTPPAWLPEDLLPESYRTLNQASPRTVTASTPVLPQREPKVSRRRGRRLLGLTALLALLAWSGHKVWQEGRVEIYLKSLRGATDLAKPSPAPRPQAAAPAAMSHTMDPASGPLAAPASSIPKIGAQIGR